MNPSYEIVSRLPNQISSDDNDGPAITVRAYPEAIKVTYRNVFRLIPELYTANFPEAKFFVHVGVNNSTRRFQLERRARKGPYSAADVEGRPFDDEWENDDDESGRVPDEIYSDIDVNAIVEKLSQEGYVQSHFVNCGTTDRFTIHKILQAQLTSHIHFSRWEVESSTDAGLFLCEFIYFNSLLLARRLRTSQGRHIKGIFLHVPPFLDEKELEKGRDILIEIIKQMVKQGEQREES